MSVLKAVNISMIIEEFFDLLFGVLQSALNLCPDLKFDIPENFVASAVSFCRTASYFLPMGSLCSLFGMKLAVIAFRYAYSFGVMILKFIRG